MGRDSLSHWPNYLFSQMEDEEEIAMGITILLNFKGTWSLLPLNWRIIKETNLWDSEKGEEKEEEWRRSCARLHKQKKKEKKKGVANLDQREFWSDMWGQRLQRKGKKNRREKEKG